MMTSSAPAAAALENLMLTAHDPRSISETLPVRSAVKASQPSVLVPSPLP